MQTKSHVKGLEMKLEFVRIAEDALLPTYATDGSAAIDFYAHSGVFGEPLPKEGFTFGLGVKVAVPENHVLLLFSRSGHGFRNGVHLANCVGVIDPDYRGELACSLIRPVETGARLVVEPGMRICQGILFPIPKIEIAEVEQLGSTARGEGGFGSTGN